MKLFTIEHIIKFVNANGEVCAVDYGEVLVEISKDLKLLYKQNQKIMDKLDLHLEALKKIDDATTLAGAEVTRIGERITSLEETIKGMGLTAAQEDELLAKTQGIGDRAIAVASALTQMGKTPENPVPVEPAGEGEQPL